MVTFYPDENARLQAQLLEQQNTLRQMAEYNRLLSKRVAAYAREINRLKALVAKLQRMQFDKSSEKLRKKTQRQVREAEERINALQEELAETLGEQHDPALPEPLRQSSARKPLPATVPRETRVLPPQESACPACGGGLSPLGCDTGAHQQRLQGYRNAAAEAELLPVRHHRAIAGALKTHRAQLRRSRLAGAHRHGEVRRAHAALLSGGNLPPTGRGAQSGDAGALVPAPGSGKTRIVRLWAYVRDDRNAGSVMPAAAWFAYSPDRKGLHPQQHLAGYNGVLQADAYGGYNALYENGRITEGACMAHARRKIHDVHVRTPTDITTEALRRIGELYAIEAEIRGSPAEKRLSVRKMKTVPRMQSLYEWIQTQMKTLSRHAELAKAFAYLLKQWNALNLYCENGWAEIDNNIEENALRGVALGRKNWLFAGSDAGGERAALLYSLIGTCKLNGVEPEAWLRYVIGHIQDWPANRVRDLLPWKVDLASF